MKRLLIIRRKDGNLDLEYTTCGTRNFLGPTKKGEKELGKWKSWLAVDSCLKDFGLERFIELTGSEI